MQFTIILKNPFEILYVNHFGLLQQIKDNFKFVFVIMDAFTIHVASSNEINVVEAIDFLKII